MNGLRPVPMELNTFGSETEMEMALQGAVAMSVDLLAKTWVFPADTLFSGEK